MQTTSSDLAALVEQAKSGSKEAMETLYHQTNREIFYFALKMMGQEQEAYDAVQDSYLRAFKSLHQWNNAEGFLPWLHAIVRSCTKDHLMKRCGFIPVDELPAVEETDHNVLPEDYLSDQTKRQRILEIIQRLPETQRQTMLLFYYENMTTPQIALYMECSESTVKSRLNYARRAIKAGVEALEEQGTKLHPVAGLPALTRLLQSDFQQYHVPAQAERAVLDTLLAQVSVVGAPATAFTAATTTTTAAKVLAWPLATKIVALVCVVATTVGVVFAGIERSSSIAEPRDSSERTAGQNSVQNAALAAKEDVWMDAYLHLLSTEFARTGSVQDVELLDITQDGVPELLWYLEESSDDTGNRMIPYTCQNGIATPMLEDEISFFTFSQTPSAFQAVQQSEKTLDGMRYEQFQLYEATEAGRMQWKKTMDIALFQPENWVHSYVETETGKKYFTDRESMEKATQFLHPETRNDPNAAPNWLSISGSAKIRLTDVKNWEPAEQILKEGFKAYTSSQNSAVQGQEQVLNQYPSQPLTEFLLANLPSMQDKPTQDNTVWSPAFLTLMEKLFYADHNFNELHLMDVTGDQIPELLYFPGSPGNMGPFYVPYTYRDGQMLPLTVASMHHFVYRSDTQSYEALYVFPSAVGFGVSVYAPLAEGDAPWEQKLDVLLYSDDYNWDDSYEKISGGSRRFPNAAAVTAELDRINDAVDELYRAIVPFEMTVDLSAAADWSAAKRLLEDAFASYRPSPKPSGSFAGSEMLLKQVTEWVNGAIHDTGTGPTTVTEDWASVYAEFLSANCTYKDFGTAYNAGERSFWWGMQIDARDAVLTKLMIRDLKQDGVPELVIEWGIYGSGGNTRTVYEIKNGKIVQAGQLPIQEMGEPEPILPGKAVKEFSLRDSVVGGSLEAPMQQAIQWLEDQAVS